MAKWQSKKEQFRVKPEHVILLQHAYVDWNDCDTGAPSINPKRPYGNSNIVHDVAEILDRMDDLYSANNEETKQVYGELWTLHWQTQVALQILLCTSQLEPGLYEKQDSYVNRSWKRIGD